MFVPSKQLAEEHYKDLSSKPFFPKLVDYIISGPVVAMVKLNYAQPQVFHRRDHTHFRASETFVVCRSGKAKV